MAHVRTGTLDWKPNKTNPKSCVAKFWVGETRHSVKLDTLDPILARRMLNKYVKLAAAGKYVARDIATAPAQEPFEDTARAWCEARKARGVAMADSELGYFVHHVFVHADLMSVPVTEWRRLHCKTLLERACQRKSTRTGERLSLETIGHLHRLIGRFFTSLEGNEVIAASPMRTLKMSNIEGLPKEDDRKRVPITDAEYDQFLAAPVDFTPAKKSGKPRCHEVEFFEMKIIAWTARTLGGQRACECLRWTWDMIDREAFSKCKIHRAKGGGFKDLEIPEMLQPYIKGWWLASGCPTLGPVFPVSRGKRKGEARGKSNLAGRFRRALWRAGVRRFDLHNDTPHSLQTDFHTRRREFTTGTTTSGLNPQQAGQLTGHSTTAMLDLYDQSDLKVVPVAALPQINAKFSPPRVSVGTLGPMTPEGPPANDVESQPFSERGTRFELATSSLGNLGDIEIVAQDGLEPITEYAHASLETIADYGDESHGDSCEPLGSSAFDLEYDSIV